MKLQLKFETYIELDGKIPSLNNYYKPRRGGKGLYKTPEVHAFQNNIKKQLRAVMPDEIKASLREVEKFKLELDFVMMSGANSRDYDNMIKGTQDAIFDFLNINDNTIFHGEQRKWDRNAGSKEFIRIRIYETFMDFSMFNQ